MFFGSCFRLFRLTIHEWLDDDVPRLGAALAFYSMLSLGPLLLLIVTAGAFLFGRKATEGQIVAQVSGVIGPEAAETLQTILKTAAHDGHSGLIATIFGFVALLFGASGVFGELQAAMNIIWKVKPRPGKPWLSILRERFFAFVMVAGCGCLMLASLALSTALNAASKYAFALVPGLNAAVRRADIVISLGIAAGLFALIFKFVPDIRVRWRDVWPGAGLTAVLFVTGKMLIGFYLARSGLASAFGAAGSLVIILVWVYYSAQILFFGAEFTQVYARHRCDETRIKNRADS